MNLRSFTLFVIFTSVHPKYHYVYLHEKRLSLSKRIRAWSLYSFELLYSILQSYTTSFEFVLLFSFSISLWGRRNYRTAQLNSDLFSLVYKYGSFKPIKRIRYDFLQFSFIIILTNRTFLLSKKTESFVIKTFGLL